MIRSDLHPLKPHRVHEASGPAAVSFALWNAAHMNKAVLWIQERWSSHNLNPNGFDSLDPAQLIVAKTNTQIDTLAIAEEALRDGAIPFVVLEISAPISLTAGRRLQLAAKAGGTTGLCLIPTGMGSNATETRWHCAPVFSTEDSTLQFWNLKKNKSGTLGFWHVRWDAAAHRISVVSPVGKRPGPARAPG